MTERTPDFAAAFSCLGGACPDNCCRQGWEIVIDEQHLRRYRAIGGDLGARILSALTQNAEGQTVFRMESGTCVLLEKSGLCPIAAACGEEGLCTICHTHPRFIEQYGANREIHFSLSCPEAARLALERTAPCRFVTQQTNEAVTETNALDPKKYYLYRAARRFAEFLLRDRTISLADRFGLLLAFARQIDREKDPASARRRIRAWYRQPYRQRKLLRMAARRPAKVSYLPEAKLFSAAEHLTAEAKALAPRLADDAPRSEAFDRDFERLAERLAILWVDHYALKAVNDDDFSGKCALAVYGCTFVRRACYCTGRTDFSGVRAFAGLFAKEIEHSPENLEFLQRTWRQPGWYRHLAASFV